MQNDALHRYFSFVLRLRHFLQLQENFEDGWKKLPLPHRLLWILPLASFAAAGFAVLRSALQKRRAEQQRKKRFPYT